MKSTTLRLSRAYLADAVAPEPLIPTLQSLVDSGALRGFREHGAEIVVWGDTHRLEIALESAANQEDAPDPAEPTLNGKALYFQRCREFMQTKSFFALPVLHKQIWKLHAAGMTHQAICFKLALTPMKVRVAIQGARLAAKLPRVVSTLGHGKQPGEPAKCNQEGCPQKSRARGLCVRHYQWFRKGSIR